MASDSAYHRSWARKNSRRYHYTQLKWYYKNRARVLQSWSKPKGPSQDEYDKWVAEMELKKLKEIERNENI